MKNSFLIFSLFIFLTFTLSGKPTEIKITNVNTDNYPILDVEISAVDENGEEQESRNFINSLEIKDSGNLVDVIESKCLDIDARFSLIFLADNSISMLQDRNSSNTDVVPKPNRRWDAIMEAMQELLLNNDLNSQQHEFAIMKFAGSSEVVYEFRNDFGSQRLEDDLKSFADDIYFIAITDFDAALLGINSLTEKPNGIGAIEYSQQAKYQPIIILLTDGKHSRLTSLDIHKDLIIETIQNSDDPPIIYLLTYGEKEDKVLAEIVAASGGWSEEGIANKGEVNDIFNQVIEETSENFQIIPPCIFQIETSSGGGEITATAKINGETFSSDPYFYEIISGIQKQLIGINIKNSDGNIFVTSEESLNYSCQIIDMLGVVLYSNNFRKELSISSAEFPSGNYILRISFENRQFVQKIQIK
jgi:uncharacterized protein YegL